MSLVRLLTAGRSLVGVKDSTNRYRMSDPRAMPKFNSARNPFRATANPESARPAEGGLNETVSGKLPTAEAAETAAARASMRAQGAVKAGQGEAGQGGSASGSPSKQAGWLSRWMSRLTGRFSSAPAKPAQAAIPRFEKQPVQGELSLDSIQVVRNDLSDADLEVVPAKPRPAAVSSTAELPGAEGVAESVGTGWSRAATRLLGVGKS